MTPNPPRLAASFVRCIAPLLILLPAGCGQGDTTVEGNVTLGGQPVDGGMIKFVPLGGSGSGGQIDIKGGRYASEPSWKLTPGKYRVEINWHDTTWKPTPTRTDSGAVTAETKQRVPNRYNSQSELTADLKSGRNSGVNFDLTSDGPIDTSPKNKAVRD